MISRTNLTTRLEFCVSVIVMLCSIAGADVIYVDVNTPDNNDGSSWAKAYKYLQDALAAAGDGNDIWVAKGTYYPDANSAVPGDSNDPNAAFQLINGVGVYGGFASGGGDWNSRDPNAYETILSGDINTPADNNDNSYHVVTGSGTDATAILDGFTINLGYANGSYPNNNGGGMYIDSGSPTVVNCTFTGNWAGYIGGGMYNSYGSPTVTNCTFSGNAGGSGGGMYNAGDSNLVNCTFSGNSAGHGGGMYNSGDSNLVNCTFSGNWAVSGGGMYNSPGSSPTTVTNCTFSGNVSTGLIGGGGMYNDYSSPTVTNCTFSNNLACNYGGGMYNEDASPTVTNCVFGGNSADFRGGGMYNYFFSSPTVTNCTFSGNKALWSVPDDSDGGGGMANYLFSCPAVTNCTFTGNESFYVGSGMCNNQDASPTVTNCILWGNYAAGGDQIYDYETSSTTVTYSCM